MPFLDQVGDSSDGVMYHNRVVELLLEYGPDWRTDLLHDIHTSCSDMFQYPVFCRDGVFWSCKLLLASVSQVSKSYFHAPIHIT